MLISVGNENSIKFVLSWLILFAQYGIIKRFDSYINECAYPKVGNVNNIV